MSREAKPEQRTQNIRHEVEDFLSSANERLNKLDCTSKGDGCRQNPNP